MNFILVAKSLDAGDANDIWKVDIQPCKTDLRVRLYPTSTTDLRDHYRKPDA